MRFRNITLTLLAAGALSLTACNNEVNEKDGDNNSQHNVGAAGDTANNMNNGGQYTPDSRHTEDKKSETPANFNIGQEDSMSKTKNVQSR